MKPLLLTLLIASLATSAYGESEYGDLGATNPELQAQYQKQADDEFRAQAEAGLQRTIAAANAGHYRVTVVAPDGTATVYGNGLPPEPEAVADVRQATLDITTMQQHLAEMRVAAEAAKAQGRADVLRGREDNKHLPPGPERAQAENNQADSEAAQARAQEEWDKIDARHETEVAAEIQKRQRQLKVLISLENGTKGNSK